MISFKGGIDAKAAVDEKREVGRIVMTEEGFGSPDVEKRDSTRKYKDCYTEGPWFMKRGKNYYMLYAAGGVPEANSGHPSFTVRTTRVSNPVRYPHFRASASVRLLQAAFAIGVLRHI